MVVAMPRTTVPLIYERPPLVRTVIVVEVISKGFLNDMINGLKGDDPVSFLYDALASSDEVVYTAKVVAEQRIPEADVSSLIREVPDLTIHSRDRTLHDVDCPCVACVEVRQENP